LEVFIDALTWDKNDKINMSEDHYGREKDTMLAFEIDIYTANEE